MRTTYTFFVAFLFLSFSATAQCVVDTTHFSGTKYTFPDTMPCAVKGALYDTTVQVKLPKNVYADEFSPTYPHIQVRVDSVRIDSITDLPDSIGWTMTPATKKIYAPGYGCFSVYGNAVADTGTYSVGVWGIVWFNVLGKDTFQKGNFSAVFPVKIRVIEPGTPCYGNVSGIVTMETNVIAVYPVPFSSLINIVADGEILESVQLFDPIGRLVASDNAIRQLRYVLKPQIPLEKGLYVLKVKTSKGQYSRQILTNND